MATVRLSKKFSLDIPDVIRGGLLAVGAAVLTIIQRSLEAGELNFNWKLIGTTAISTFIAYLVKNYAFEPPKTIVVSDTNTKAVNATERVKEAV